MSASYEFWLTDDAGEKITLLNNFSYVSYSRSTRGLGTITFGMPFNYISPLLPTIFQPDWRIDVWRSPADGYPKVREGSFFLRKYRVYDREEDRLRQIQYYGRSPLDILRRWIVTPTVEAKYKKTDYIDDMMKAIVNECFVSGGSTVPTGELTVDGDLSLGPVITHEFPGENVRDVLSELKAISYYMNLVDSSDRKIYFDVVEGPGIGNGFGYIFRTYADLRGTDRSDGVIFCPENGNVGSIQYYEDYLEQITEAQIGKTVVTNSTDIYLSRWNHIRTYQSSSSTSQASRTSVGRKILNENGKQLFLAMDFLNTPGSKTTPRSLYGVDWDLGDLLRVQYANKYFDAEVEVVWVSVDENGIENIVGQNYVGEY